MKPYTIALEAEAPIKLLTPNGMSALVTVNAEGTLQIELRAIHPVAMMLQPEDPQAEAEFAPVFPTRPQPNQHMRLSNLILIGRDEFVSDVSVCDNWRQLKRDPK